MPTKNSQCRHSLLRRDVMLLLVLMACMFVSGIPTARAAFGAGGVAGACAAYQQPCNGTCISERDLCILEPIPGSGANGHVITAAEATAQGGLGAFYKYINDGIWQWAFGLGVAIAILNGTVGGLQIVLSNGDSGKSEAGKTRFIWSTMGLLLLLFAGVILEFINPIGFNNV